ncbi:hypothetical protein [Arthrobacter woluwensis]|uniref:hypothetical protein n=1 Tax=Arthrobacter woluwensis TaxID=156980 RepID=UPI00119FD12B|nr:hypothetical protein [Arthrobacter woluwensis]
MTECTTKDCGNPTSTYLCTQCVEDLEQVISSAVELLPHLDPVIARQATTKPPGATGAGGTDPGLNFTALQLKFDIETMIPARELAKYEDAADIAGIYRWIESQTELAISGPRPEHVDHEAIKERVRFEAPPMKVRDLVPWLRTNAKVTITGKDIRNWASRGKLHRVETDGQPAYHPHEVLNAWHETRQHQGF